MRENETEAGKVRWVRWVRPDGPDDVGGPVGQRWGRPDKDGDGQTKMGTNPDTLLWSGTPSYMGRYHRRVVCLQQIVKSVHSPLQQSQVSGDSSSR